MGRKSKVYVTQDRLFKQAKAEGFRSRAAFKLIEIAQKTRLFRPGMMVLDLGAAPGAWSQVASEAVGESGLVVGADLVATTLGDPSPQNWRFLQGDLRVPEIQEKLRDLLTDLHRERVDVVLSDLSHKLTGIRMQDHQRSLELAQTAFALACRWLQAGGALVMKVFPGEDLEGFRAELKKRFTEVRLFHLESTRKTSREVYLVALNFKPG